MYTVMIVDDQQDLVDGLAIHFRSEGYKVLKAYDGNTALTLAAQENPHLILLDVMMPGMSGLEVCAGLRKKEVDTRIIMMSARGEEIDRVVGLEVGADDFVSKPFSIRELLALVRARLRYRDPAACDFVSRYRFEDAEIDFERMRATKHGVPVELTPREFDLLHFLIQHRGQAVTRERILDKVWGRGNFTTQRTVDNHILRLRKKLEPEPGNPKYIISVYGGGYKFVG
jgi:DNA-binding response OmpR family regulator